MTFRRTQPIIGMVPEFMYQDQEAVVPPGSRLFVFSDGAYELHRPDDSLFTMAELGAYLGRFGAAERPDLNGLVEALRAVQGRAAFDDDFSMMVLEF
jgi:serine phosphatase RsbU (regulator of sigma subunit)